MNYKEFKIGEEFELDKIIYKVVRANSCSCNGCAFYIEGESKCTDYNHRTGNCSRKARKDGYNVIFIKVEESTE